MNHLAHGDRVEWIGPPSDHEGDPQPGDLGMVIILDPPDEWVVQFDTAGTWVVADRAIKKIDAGN